MLSRMWQQFKAILRDIISSISKRIYWLIYLRYIKKINHKNELVIFDLDNTIADTFPYLQNRNLKEVYSKVTIHSGMTNILEECLMTKKKVIILSARSFKYHSITKNWINRNLSKIQEIPLFLVPLAEDKLPYLNKALEHTNRITYYDDLSYNHENGKVKFYENLITQVKQLPINYIGYNEINYINNIK